eukprot:gene9284-6526_t
MVTPESQPSAPEDPSHPTSLSWWVVRSSRGRHIIIIIIWYLGRVLLLLSLLAAACLGVDGWCSASVSSWYNAGRLRPLFSPNGRAPDPVGVRCVPRKPPLSLSLSLSNILLLRSPTRSPSRTRTPYATYLPSIHPPH